MCELSRVAGVVIKLLPSSLRSLAKLSALTYLLFIASYMYVCAGFI